MPDSLFPSDAERAFRREKMQLAKQRATTNKWRVPKRDTKVSPHEVPPDIPAWQLDFSRKTESPEQISDYASTCKIAVSNHDSLCD